ncbi:MAG: hypothetical protein ACSHX8_11365 [Opitutaceae bacterium]
MKPVLKTLLFIGICAAIPVGYYFYLTNQQATPPIAQEVVKPEVVDPVVKMDPTPPPPPVEAEVIVTPEPAPDPIPRPDPLEWALQNWRSSIHAVTITKEQAVPVYIDGQAVGEAQLAVGQMVPVEMLTDSTVTIRFLDNPHLIPVEATDLIARANKGIDNAILASTRPAPVAPMKQVQQSTAPEPTAMLDVIAFGSASSEREHDFRDKGSKVIKGGLDQPAREIAPTQNWKGGSLYFKMKVDADKPNYLTVKFWGNDIVHDRLVVFVDEKQLGYYHLGDYDVLDIGAVAKIYPDRFYYTTIIIPEKLTRGKDELELEIRAQGGIWAYGRDFDQYQHATEKPSRGIYAAYTHTDSFFVPLASEQQGKAPDVKKRTSPGKEVLDRVKERINGRIKSILSKKDVHQEELRIVARCYHIKWSDAYKNKAAIKTLLECGDRYYQMYLQDPDAVTDKETHQWTGLGHLGESIWLLHKAIDNRDWNEDIHNGTTRREAWSEMLVYSRDWNMGNRRKYTNQTMIKDLYGVYLANKGLRYVDPSKALEESVAVGMLHEAVGIKPWLGPIDKDGKAEKPAGDNYYQLTYNGLTKELGYVGHYGEVQDWAALIYQATRSYPGEPGDPEILKQLSKINRARSYFRYPTLDDDGYPAMRMESVVGWRDFKYPGDVVYGQKPASNGSALQTAAATKDPYDVGFAQQLIDDGQFFASVEYQLTLRGMKEDIGILHLPEEYETIRKLPQSPYKLPMSPDQPDSVFSDEEDGVIALKNNGEILYISLYWRARYAINNVARIHHMTPEYARIATVWQETEFSDSGMTYERENWTNFGFAGGGRQRYPEKWDSAHEGEKLKVARTPSGIEYKVGDENTFAGKGDFYTLHYGPYLIGMNCTTDKTYDLEIPDALRGQQVKNLVTGESFNAFGKTAVKPRSTVVLYRP